MISQPTLTRSVSFSSKSSSEGNKRRAPRRGFAAFPKRLYNLLENAEREGYDHLISWLPHGKSFQIHAIQKPFIDPEEEEELVEILQRFSGQTKLKSFLRQLQLYGFHRNFKRGDSRGECRHNLFVRGNSEAFANKTVEDFRRESGNIQRFTSAKTVVSGANRLQTLVASMKQTAAAETVYKRKSIVPIILSNLVADESDSDNSSIESSDDSESSRHMDDTPLDLSEEQTCDEKAWRELERKLLGL